MGGPGQDESLRKKARTGQIACAILMMISAAFGITSIIFTAQANVCNSPGPGFEPEMGTYGSVFLDDNPRNCILDCQNDCYSIYVESTHLREECQACFVTCTYPWDDKINECEEQAVCTATFDADSDPIENFCRPLSVCYKHCASDCIGDCEDAGYTAVWSGMVSLIFFLLAFFLPLAIGTPAAIVTPFFIFLGALCWAGSLALAADAFNLNIGGKGWTLKEVEFTSGGKITPNWLPGTALIIGLMANVFMILAYYDYEEIWNKRPPKPPHQEPPEPVEAPIEPLPYYVPGKDDGEIDGPALQASLVQRSLSSASPAPTSPQIGRGGSVSPMMSPTMSSMQSPQLTATNNTTIGLSFMHNQQGEAVVEVVQPRGPADISVDGVGRIVPGDVVIQVGLFPPMGGEPNMVDVSRTPIKEWFPMLKNRPSGSRVRFIFARHEIRGKYHVDLTFRPKFGMP